MKKYLFCAIFMALRFSAQAQEPKVYSQFFMNPFIYNPAYAGVDGHTVIYTMYRRQWTGISDGPALGHLSFHVPLQGGIGVGGFAFTETQGILKSSAIKGSVSYLVDFDRKHWLRFGLSLGVGSNTLDTDQLDNPFDPAFANAVDNSLYALGDFGVTFHSGHFNAGVSLPNLFSYDIITEKSFSPILVQPLDRIFGKLNYSIGFLDDEFVWEPHFLYRYSKYTADQYEFASIIHVMHHIWFGASYRQDAGILGLFGIKVKEKLAIGYAFELGDSKIRSFTGNSHEIHIGFHLGSRKDHAEHVSSFIKRHRKTAEEQRDERLAKLEGDVQTPDPDQNSLLVRNDPVEQTAEDPVVEDPIVEVPVVEDPVVEQPPIIESGNEDATKLPVTEPNVSVPTGNQTPVNNSVPVPEPTPVPSNNLSQDTRSREELVNSNQPLRVKKGTHMLELQEGNYVVNGAFEIFENAEKYSDKLFEEGFHDVKVGFLSARGLYYVVVFQSKELSPAAAQRDRLKSNSEFSETWLLTVE